MIKRVSFWYFILVFLSFISCYAADEGFISGEGVRLREKPGGKIVTKLNKNEKVEILEKIEKPEIIDATSAPWYKVRTQDNKEGWVFGQFVGLNSKPMGSSGRFWVAVVELDGCLIPFAMFDGSKWTKPWPDADQGGDVKIASLADVPKAWFGGENVTTAWKVWHSDKFVPLTVTHPKLLDPAEHYGSNIWGLTSGYHNSGRSIRLATNSEHRIRDFIDLKSDSQEKSRVISFLSPELDKMEKDKISTPGFKYNHPLSHSERMKTDAFTDPSKFYIYRIPFDSSGFSLYYFEIIKEYNTHGGGPYTFFSGWLMENKENLSFVDKNIKLGEGDAYDYEQFMPLGSLEINNSMFIFTQYSVYEAAGLSVFELKKDQKKIQKLVQFSLGGA